VRFRTIHSIGVGLLVTALAAAPAAAQDVRTQGFIGGLGGATFGTASGSGMLGVQGGYRIGPELFVIGEFGRMMDVLPGELGDMVDFFEEELEDELGAPVTLEVTAPATYGFGGVRWTRGMGRAKPFVEGGIGVARVKLEVGEASFAGIDLTDLVNDQLEGEEPETTEFLFTFGGGVNLALTDAVSADAGYRFTRIATDDPNVNVSAIYGAVKILFR